MKNPQQIPQLIRWLLQLLIAILTHLKQTGENKRASEE